MFSLCTRTFVINASLDNAFNVQAYGLKKNTLLYTNCMNILLTMGSRVQTVIILGAKKFVPIIIFCIFYTYLFQTKI